MTRTRTTIVAQYPPGPLLLFLLILLLGDYFCIDLRFIHYLVFSGGITANSPWFWVIFGGLIVLTLHCVKQIFFPTVLLKADLSGLELRHRALRPKIRVGWQDVQQISSGQVAFSMQKGRSMTPAVRLLLKTKENLGGVISNMTQADGGNVSFAALLFEDDVDETVHALKEMRANALGQRPSDSEAS